MTIKTQFTKTTLPRIQFEVRDSSGIQTDVVVSLEWDPYYLCPCSATEGGELGPNKITWRNQTIPAEYSVSFACKRAGTANTTCRADGGSRDSSLARIACPSKGDKPSAYKCGEAPMDQVSLESECQDSD